eukprot:CAMPEP_0170364824 /NCGR_PEP_ID=MMETSP0117_2-20130122/5583_1 /TAXON_ID=400756 /ORGANISM="Durinskia baltica, Strain CSIRO CS-38" /LENGTH=95 /DNA_ID=CAMNT_0010619357 /DNA_START=144 /DNA_END=428 /DNA_ORIENTATION=+
MSHWYAMGPLSLNASKQYMEFHSRIPEQQTCFLEVFFKLESRLLLTHAPKTHEQSTWHQSAPWPCGHSEHFEAWWMVVVGRFVEHVHRRRKARPA